MKINPCRYLFLPSEDVRLCLVIDNYCSPCRYNDEGEKIMIVGLPNNVDAPEKCRKYKPYSPLELAAKRYKNEEMQEL